jgi:hypothetical protein
MITTLPTRSQQHITYKQIAKISMSLLCLRHLTTLSWGRCKTPNDTRNHWLSPSSRRPLCRQQLQLLHHKHHPLSWSHFKSQQHSTEELTCHCCQAHHTHDRAAPISCKVLRWPPLQEEASRDRRLSQSVYVGMINVDVNLQRKSSNVTPSWRKWHWNAIVTQSGKPDLGISPGEIPRWKEVWH